MNLKPKLKEILASLDTPAAKSISPEEMRQMFNEAIRFPNEHEEELPVIGYIKSVSSSKNACVLDLSRLLELVLAKVNRH